ncbi:MAG: hypothetical protein HFJ99_06320 [Eubacterium sp.]|jgi:hypothetical protein|nr:hypothetical protein [Eubacterium sp.]
MISLVVFIAVGIILRILSLFYEIELVHILILSILTSILVSIPYYSNKILRELHKCDNKNHKE